MTNRRLAIWLAAFAAPALGQPGFTAPGAGFVYLPASRTIRPVVGVSGAAYLGAPVLSGTDAAWISPGGAWAFVTAAANSRFVRGLGDTAPADCAVDGVIAGVDRVAWSSGASFAVLYSSSANQLQRVRLGADGVSADAPVDLSAWGQPDTLAIDAGGRIAFAIAEAGVFLAQDGQAPVLLMSLARPATVAFSDQGLLYAAEAETGRIVEFGADSSPADFGVVDEPDGTVFQPAGLAVSGTGEYLMIVDKASQTVRIYETATRTGVQSIPLDFPPTHLQRLSTGATFLLNRPAANQWLLLLDAAGTPRVYFVPAPGDDAQ